MSTTSNEAEGNGFKAWMTTPEQVLLLIAAGMFGVVNTLLGRIIWDFFTKKKEKDEGMEDRIVERLTKVIEERRRRK